jgi:hypothetical protein
MFTLASRSGTTKQSEMPRALNPTFRLSALRGVEAEVPHHRQDRWVAPRHRRAIGRRCPCDLVLREGPPSSAHHQAHVLNDLSETTGFLEDTRSGLVQTGIAPGGEPDRAASPTLQAQPQQGRKRESACDGSNRCSMYFQRSILPHAHRPTSSIGTRTRGIDATTPCSNCSHSSAGRWSQGPHRRPRR